jgi:hypothetical protein
MKRSISFVKSKGIDCVLVRHGGKHDWFRNSNTGVSQPVPRHREIGDVLARKILRMLANREADEKNVGTQ